MEYNYNEDYIDDFIEQQKEEFDKVLMELVNEDKISMSVNEDGEFIFYMTEEQKERSYVDFPEIEEGM
jgi:predicted O-methyltransferase YrrM